MKKDGKKYQKYKRPPEAKQTFTLGYANWIDWAPLLLGKICIT